MIVLRLQTGVRSHFVTRMPEWGLSFGLLDFARRLTISGDSFSSSAGYRLLERYVCEATWAKIALGIAVTWLAALVLNGTFKHTRRWSPWVRSLCAFAASVFWGVNAFAFEVAVPDSPGVTNNSLLAFLAVASSIISAREVGASDRSARKCPQSPPKIG